MPDYHERHRRDASPGKLRRSMRWFSEQERGIKASLILLLATAVGVPTCIAIDKPPIHNEIKQSQPLRDSLVEFTSYYLNKLSSGMKLSDR